MRGKDKVRWETVSSTYRQLNPRGDKYKDGGVRLHARTPRAHVSVLMIYRVSLSKRSLPAPAPSGNIDILSGVARVFAGAEEGTIKHKIKRQSEYTAAFHPAKCRQYYWTLMHSGSGAIPKAPVNISPCICSRRSRRRSRR